MRRKLFTREQEPIIDSLFTTFSLPLYFNFPLTGFTLQNVHQDFLLCSFFRLLDYVKIIGFLLIHANVFNFSLNKFSTVKVVEMKNSTRNFNSLPRYEKPAEFQNTRNSSAERCWKSRNFPPQHSLHTNTHNCFTPSQPENLQRGEILRVFHDFPVLFHTKGAKLTQSNAESYGRN